MAGNYNKCYFAGNYNKCCFAGNYNKCYFAGNYNKCYFAGNYNKYCFAVSFWQPYKMLFCWKSQDQYRARILKSTMGHLLYQISSYLLQTYIFTLRYLNIPKLKTNIGFPPRIFAIIFTIVLRLLRPALARCLVFAVKAF